MRFARKTIEEIGQRDQLHAFVCSKSQEMPIACDNEVCMGVHGALEDAVVGFIFYDTETGSGPDDDGHATDGLHEFSRLLFRPVELALEDRCRLGKNRDGCEQFESSTEGAQVGIFRPAAGNPKG